MNFLENFIEKQYKPSRENIGVASGDRTQHHLYGAEAIEMSF